MKKILFVAFLAFFSTSSAYAAGGHGGSHGGGWGGAWIIPALIGSAIVYDMHRPQTVYVQPAPYAPVYTPAYVPTYAPGYVQDYAQGYAPSVSPPSAQYWYFCAATNAYYPYVRSCPSGWQPVPTTPPAALSQ
jgi:hypothetical protein